MHASSRTAPAPSLTGVVITVVLATSPAALVLFELARRDVNPAALALILLCWLGGVGAALAFTHRQPRHRDDEQVPDQAAGQAAGMPAAAAPPQESPGGRSWADLDTEQDLGALLEQIVRSDPGTSRTLTPAVDALAGQDLATEHLATEDLAGQDLTGTSGPERRSNDTPATDEVTAPAPRRTADGRRDRAPVPRQRTVGGVALPEPPAAGDGPGPGAGPGVPDAARPDVDSVPAAPVTPGNLDRVRVPTDVIDTLQFAWLNEDADELAAIGARLPTLRLAAYVLAGVVAGRAGDPRAFTYLQEALDTGADLAADVALAPYLAELTVEVDVPELDVHLHGPATRSTLAAALATGERLLGDRESAWAALLDVPATGVAALVRALTELDLDWPDKALGTLTTAGMDRPASPDAQAPDADRRESCSGELGVAWQVLTGQALTGTGRPQEALPVLAAALEQLGRDKLEASTLGRRALLAYAQAHLAAGDGDAAWDTARELLQIDPHDAGALQILRHS